MSGRRVIRSLPAILVLLGGGATALAGQLPDRAQPADTVPAFLLEAGPTLAWGDGRRGGVGGRTEIAVLRRFRLVGEGLVFFPDLNVAEPNASAAHRSTQANLDLLIDLNRRGPIRVYLGLGLGYTRLRIDLTVDDRTEGVTFSNAFTNRIVGVRWPAAFGTPFVQFTSQVRSNDPWVLSAGFTFRLAGG